jgi:hypothetical protein
MSATNRSDVRDPEDHYKTEKWVTQAILPILFEDEGGRDSDLLDPCAGTGAILDAVRDYRAARKPDEGGSGISLRGIELHEGRCSETQAKGLPCVQGDALAMPWGGPHFVLQNPPYSQAMAFVLKALGEVGKDGTVAVLLRLSWLESAERKAFHKEHPSDLYVFSQRPSFCASVKCKGRAGKRDETSTVVKRKGCGWHAVYPVEGPWPTRCPDCDGSVSVTTSDSAAYAWLLWGPGRGNRWFLLDAEKP